MSENENKKPENSKEKQYIPVCIVMCILSLILGAGVFFFGSYMAQFSKFNSTLSSKWVRTDMLVIGLVDEKDVIPDSLVKFPYIGDIRYILRYNYDAYGDTISQGGNNKELAYFSKDVAVGDRVDAYFKADDPQMIRCKIPYAPYLIAVIILLAVAVALALWARFISRAIVDSRPKSFKKSHVQKKKLKVSFMDIPAAMFIIAFVGCFVAGTIVGTSRVGSEYTEINEQVAQSLSSKAELYQANADY